MCEYVCALWWGGAFPPCPRRKSRYTRVCYPVRAYGEVGFTFIVTSYLGLIITPYKLYPVLHRSRFSLSTCGSGYLEWYGCYASPRKIPLSHRLILVDKDSSRKVHTCFLDSLSLAQVKACGMFYFH